MWFYAFESVKKRLQTWTPEHVQKLQNVAGDCPGTHNPSGKCSGKRPDFRKHTSEHLNHKLFSDWAFKTPQSHADFIHFLSVDLKTSTTKHRLPARWIIQFKIQEQLPRSLPPRSSSVCLCAVSCDSACVNIGGAHWENVCFIARQLQLRLCVCRIHTDTWRENKSTVKFHRALGLNFSEWEVSTDVSVEF